MAMREDNECVRAAIYSNTNSTFPSVIKDGAVSGVLPEAEVVAVHYPGYPSSASRAIETLGGLQKITKAFGCALQNLDGTQDSDKDRRRFLTLKFRPEDPYCHPAFGEPRPSTSLLLKISRTPNVNDSAYAGVSPERAEQLSADVVANVSLAYRFEGMADYQHVIAVHAAESRRKKRPWVSDDELFLDDEGNVDMDNEDVMKLVPPLFARKDKPEMIVLNTPTNLLSESLQKGAVEYSWEMDIQPCHAIPFSIHKIPEKINWEDKLLKGTTEWKEQMAVAKLFEERPIWPRWSLHERLLDDGLEVTDYLLRRLLFRTGYYFSRGPFGRFWIRKGYDPREDPDSRIYQKVDFRMPPSLRNLKDVNANADGRLKHKWKDICKFRVWPSKASNCLQLFELDDDYIHQEIKKPTTMTTCSPLTGWFSEAMLKALRLHVMIRFMEVTPNGAPEELLKSKIEHFKRCRNKEALSKFWKPEKELCHGDQDASLSRQIGGKSKITKKEVQKEVCRLEDEECEEEEEEPEEPDAYESPEMVLEDGVLPYSASYEMGDTIPNEYLQELLNGFTYTSKDGGGRQTGSGDDEYQIYEQDSDDDYDYL
ncbi:transcription factor tau subunit sfc1-like [Phalaenopsis equestris]|uniref:transcription factor tau subunit sfc1-like n=1 Tax=Phalaenopsis equestris TaxID=78828 RepID=UPI0009E2574A|nr:transcription factor tau subunit sfc1-like [Phalaenopsis equestris]XP_020578393.1 transcription factor tau subunit sfc1-like [Phalaenopsis equestris]